MVHSKSIFLLTSVMNIFRGMIIFRFHEICHEGVRFIKLTLDKPNFAKLGLSGLKDGGFHCY